MTKETPPGRRTPRQRIINIATLVNPPSRPTDRKLATAESAQRYTERHGMTASSPPSPSPEEAAKEADNYLEEEWEKKKREIKNLTENPLSNNFDKYINSHTPRQVREYLDKLTNKEKNKIAKAKKMNCREMIDEVLGHMSLLESAAKHWGFEGLTMEEFIEESSWRWKAMTGRFYIPSPRSVEVDSERELQEMLEGILRRS
jgi:hypothetical protein